MADYIYVFAPILGALLIAMGGFVVTVNPSRLRHARAWFFSSILPLLIVPITFGITYENKTVALTGAALGAALLGMIYYGAWCFINEQIGNADQGSRNSVREDAPKRD